MSIGGYQLPFPFIAAFIAAFIATFIAAFVEAFIEALIAPFVAALIHPSHIVFSCSFPVNTRETNSTQDPGARHRPNAMAEMSLS